ncbi:MAG: hypothetical protein ACRD0U_10910 [Acidimicrobiales bacterium]
MGVIPLPERHPPRMLDGWGRHSVPYTPKFGGLVRHVTFTLDRNPLFGDVVVTYLIEPMAQQPLSPEGAPADPLPAAITGGGGDAGDPPPGDLIMMRRQLLTLKDLAERDARRQ